RPVHLRAAVDQIQQGFGGHECGKFLLYHWPLMRIFAALMLVAAATAACGGFLRQYEYEEDVYLSLDGTAIVYVNSSIAALDALRGASFDPSPAAPVDRQAVREYFASPIAHVSGRVAA